VSGEISAGHARYDSGLWDRPTDLERAAHRPSISASSTPRPTGRVGVFAQQLVGEHPDAVGLGQGAGLPVQDLPGRRHPGVPDQRTGQFRRLGREQVVVVGAPDDDVRPSDAPGGEWVRYVSPRFGDD